MPASWIKRAQCLRHLGDLHGAIDCYEAVVQNEPEDADSRLALAEIYERTSNRERALELVNEVLKQRARIQDQKSDESGSQYSASEQDTTASGNESAEVSDGGTRRRSKKGRDRGRRKRRQNAQRRLTATLTREEKMEEDRRLQIEFDANLLKLQEIDRTTEQKKTETGELDSALVYEWLEVVSFLIDTYRTTRALFPSDGKKKFAGLFKPVKKRGGQVERDVEEEANTMASRLQAGMEDEEAQPVESDTNVEYDSYRGVTFDEWAKLAVRVRVECAFRSAHPADSVIHSTPLCSPG